MIQAPAEEQCACGQPLHYSVPGIRKMVEQLIASKGPLIKVSTPKGTWLVPRHYIALHGLRASDLPMLARRLGFKQVA